MLNSSKVPQTRILADGRKQKYFSRAPYNPFGNSSRRPILSRESLCGHYMPKCHRCHWWHLNTGIKRRTRTVHRIRSTRGSKFKNPTKKERQCHATHFFFHFGVGDQTWQMSAPLCAELGGGDRANELSIFGGIAVVGNNGRNNSLSSIYAKTHACKKRERNGRNERPCQVYFCRPSPGQTERPLMPPPSQAKVKPGPPIYI